MEPEAREYLSDLSRVGNARDEIAECFRIYPTSGFQSGKRSTNVDLKAALRRHNVGPRVRERIPLRWMAATRERSWSVLPGASTEGERRERRRARIVALTGQNDWYVRLSCGEHYWVSAIDRASDELAGVENPWCPSCDAFYVAFAKVPRRRSPAEIKKAHLLYKMRGFMSVTNIVTLMSRIVPFPCVPTSPRFSSVFSAIPHAGRWKLLSEGSPYFASAANLSWVLAASQRLSAVRDRGATRMVQFT